MVSYTPRALMVALMLACIGTEAAEKDGDKPTDIRKETTDLIIQDSKAKTAVSAVAPVARPVDPSILVLSPFIVRERSFPVITPAPYEAPVMRFLRTGDIYVKAGRKTTRSISVYYEDVPGQNHTASGFTRPELGYNISW